MPNESTMKATDLERNHRAGWHGTTRFPACPLCQTQRWASFSTDELQALRFEDMNEIGLRLHQEVEAEIERRRA